MSDQGLSLIRIPKQKTHAELDVLVIDGQSLIRNVLKTALLDAGMKKIQCAHDAYTALRLCEVNKFDMILIAFNVESDKDGFNLLEEMKFKGYITKTTCVIFLSADTTQGLVNCVVEMEPTDFWVKPLDRSKVAKRIHQILTIEEKLYNLRYCFDQEEYPTAIYYGERQLQDKSLALYHPHINRLIGRSLFKLNEFQEAYNFHLKLAEIYEYAWVYIGQAASLLKLGRIEEANSLTKVLLERDDTRFATYDLLAEYHITKEEYQIGYEIIQEATKLAPRNIERNKKSWNLARLNHDALGQYVATKNMAKYAKNSIHDSPSLTMNVIRSSLDLASVLSEHESAKLLTVTEKTIKRMHQEYPATCELTEQLNVIRARMLNLRDKKSDAEAIMQHQVKTTIMPDFEDNLDKIKAFHEVGLWEKSLQLLDKLKSEFKYDSFTGKVLTEYLEQESNERRHIHYSAKELGEMASTHYKKKRYKPAFNLLRQARQLSPGNTNLAISLLKVLAVIAEEVSLNDEEKTQMNICLTILQSEKLSETQQDNLNNYKTRLINTGVELNTAV